MFIIFENQCFSLSHNIRAEVEVNRGKSTKENICTKKEQEATKWRKLHQNEIARIWGGSIKWKN